MFDWIYFTFFLGSSSTVDGIEDTFQNILDDYDDEEESVVTMMEENGDSFWRTRQFLFCYVLGVWIILLCHIMRFLLWYCLAKHLDNIIQFLLKISLIWLDKFIYNFKSIFIIETCHFIWKNGNSCREN